MLAVAAKATIKVLIAPPPTPTRLTYIKRATRAQASHFSFILIHTRAPSHTGHTPRVILSLEALPPDEVLLLALALAQPLCHNVVDLPEAEEVII